MSVYFNIRNTLPKFGTFLLGHLCKGFTSKNFNPSGNIPVDKILLTCMLSVMTHKEYWPLEFLMIAIRILAF